MEQNSLGYSLRYVSVEGNRLICSSNTVQDLVHLLCQRHAADNDQFSHSLRYEFVLRALVDCDHVRHVKPYWRIDNSASVQNS
jgi:hypothetical protein